VGGAYHPRKCVVADLFKVAGGTRILGLAADVAVHAGKPALLQIFSRTVGSLVPESRKESYSLFVDGERLEGIVYI
jgi:hypothetical protein